jgi:hypothetical protein
MKKLLPFALMGMLAFVTPTKALDFDFSGTFTQDNEVALLNFTVGSTSTITIFSSSWQSGGFDPILAIWNSSGNLMAQQDDGGNVGSTLSNSVSYNHGTWDSYYSVTLAAGSYKASIAQYNNFAVGSNLSSGFIHDGNPNFTFDLGYGGATQPLFNGVWDSNDPRTGNWAFHILNVEAANQQNVPDATSTVALLGLAMLALVGLKRKLS